MGGSWNDVKTAYDQYSGTGNSLALFLLALFVIWMAEKDRERRSVILYPSFLLLFFAVEPVIKGLTAKLSGNGAYLQAFFMLPVILVIAYGAVLVMGREKGAAALATAAALLLIMVMSGNPVWADGHLSPAANSYKLPAEDMEVFTFLLEQDDNPKVFMPGELLSGANQYTSKIDTFYHLPGDRGFEGLTEDQIKVYAQMEAQHMDSEMVCRIARREGYEYIVLREDYHFPEMPLTLLDYDEAAATEHYRIYRYKG